MPNRPAPASAWIVSLHDDFEPEFERLPADVQDALLAAAKAVQIAGPKAGRPHVDTLKGSKHANMKELRSGSMPISNRLVAAERGAGNGTQRR